MITPTGATVEEYWNAIKDGNPTHVKFEFLSQDAVVEDQDIDISVGVVVNDILNGDTDLTFGKAVMKEISTRILITDRTRYINWTDEFTLSFGVEIGGSTNWVQIGVFRGQRPSNITTVDAIDFTAYDRMQNFDILIDNYFDSASEYPLTVKALYAGICTYLNVSYDIGSAFNDAYNSSIALNTVKGLRGYTCREVLAYIAEICGCYAKFNNTGMCTLKWYTSSTPYTIYPEQEFYVEHADLYSGMTWDEFDQLTWDEADTMKWNEVCGYYNEVYGVKAVLITTIKKKEYVYPSYSERNTYHIIYNPLFPSNTNSNAFASEIYTRLTNLGGQLPARVECIGNWLLEAGDRVYVQIADEIIRNPIFMKTMVWKGSVTDTIETTGNRDRPLETATNKERTDTAKVVEQETKGYFCPLGATIEGSTISLIETVLLARWVDMEDKTITMAYTYPSFSSNYFNNQHGVVALSRRSSGNYAAIFFLPGRIVYDNYYSSSHHWSYTNSTT